MFKILASVLAASLLFANVAAAHPGHDHPDHEPLWRSLLIQAQSTARDQQRQTCLDNCTTRCTMQFDMCSGSDANYTNTVCRPQNAQCVNQCRNQC